MSRHDDGTAGGHRLEHRDPEAFEARRVDRRRSPAIEAGELGVRHEAQPADPFAREFGLLSPALAARDREQKVAAQQPVRLDERLQVLAGSSVATVRRYGAPRSAAGPSGVNSGLGAGCPTWTRPGRTRSISTTSRPVYSEFTKTRSQVSAVFRYLRACIDCVRGVTHCGNRSGTRSWIVVARTPRAAAGTSSR